MLRANLQSVTWYRLSRSLHRALGIFSLALRLSYSLLLRLRNWVTVTIMHNNRLPLSQVCLKEATATWQDANLATGEKLQPPLRGKSLIKQVTDKMKNIYFVATTTLSQSSEVKRIFVQPYWFFFFFFNQCPRDGAEKMRSGSKVYVLPQLGGNVSRGFSWSFIVNVLPLDGLKVSVFLAVGGELNMKGISKWAGRLQTSA